MDLLKNLLSQLDLEDVSKQVGIEKGDIEKVLGAFGSGVNSQQFSMEQIGSLFSSPESTSKLLSGDFLQQIAKISGIDSSKIAQLLPTILSTLGSKFSQGGLSSLVESLGAQTEGGLGGMLASALDSNKDGKISDDLLEAAKKLF